MLGRFLEETRRAAGLTQEARALAAGVDRSDVSQLERNLKSPTIETLFLVCQPIRVRPSTIIARLEKDKLK